MAGTNGGMIGLMTPNMTTSFDNIGKQVEKVKKLRKKRMKLVRSHSRKSSMSMSSSQRSFKMRQKAPKAIGMEDPSSMPHLKYVRNVMPIKINSALDY
jgi:hypothetical protein